MKLGLAANVGLLALATCVAVAALAWVAWERSPERRAERRQAEIESIEAAIRREAAERVRAQAECVATAIEFGAGGEIHAGCVSTLKAFDEETQAYIATLRVRADELRRER